MVNTTARRGAYCTAAALILLDLAYIVALATAGEPWTSPEAYGTAFKLTGMFPVFEGLTILIPYNCPSGSLAHLGPASSEGLDP